jgi:hypothetical protein
MLSPAHPHRALWWISVLVVSVIATLGVAGQAGAHDGPQHNYACGSPNKLQARHAAYSGPGTKYHQSHAYPVYYGTSSNPCSQYRAKVTVTNSSLGGSGAWYTRPNKTKTGGWASWLNSGVQWKSTDDAAYCYVVRTAAQANSPAGTHGWVFNTHGSQSSCWQG